MSFEKYDDTANTDPSDADVFSREAAKCWSPEEHSSQGAGQPSDEVKSEAHPSRIQSQEGDHAPSKGDGQRKIGDRPDPNLSPEEKAKMREQLQKFLEEQKTKEKIEEAVKKMIDEMVKKMIEQAAADGLLPKLQPQPEKISIPKHENPLYQKPEKPTLPEYENPFYRKPKENEQTIPEPDLVITPIYKNA